MRQLNISYFNNNFTLYLGHFIFFIHVLFAVIFCLERTLYSDTANFTFNIINQEDFFVGASRYSCILPQFLVIGAAKIGLSLKTLLMVYSLSFIFYYYILYNIVVYVFKNANVGLLIAFSLLLCVRHNYFMSNCEMHFAIIHCLMMFAFMEYYYNYKPFNRTVYILFVIGFIVLCFYSHIAILFAVFFILIYEALDKKEIKEIKLYLFLGAASLLVLGKLLLTEKESYEGNLFNQLSNFKSLVLNFGNLYSFGFLKAHFYDLYIYVSIAGMIVLLWYIKQKYFLKLILFVGSIFLFLFISIIIYNEGDSDMMMERAYSMLIIFALVPFMKDLYSGLKNKISLNILLVIIVFVSIRGVYEKGEFYHRRVEYISELIQKYKKEEKSKFILGKNAINDEVVMVAWAFSIETLMYSSLEGPDFSKTFYIVKDFNSFNYDKDDKSLFLFLTFAQNWNIKNLNKKYFRLKEEEYTLIK